MWHLAVRKGEAIGQQMCITGRLDSTDAVVAEIVDAALQEWSVAFAHEHCRFTVEPLRLGEWILIGHGLTSREVTDTDPLFDNLHPWMLPMPWAEASQEGGERLRSAHQSSQALHAYLAGAYQVLSGLGPFVPTTKWPSMWQRSLSFRELVGVNAAMVTSSALYRGMARLLDMTEIDIAALPGDPAAGLPARVNAGIELLAGADRLDFIHVHTKAPDEAGHTKNAEAKVAAIEACDAAIAPLLAVLDRDDLVLAVTGDHATPSEGMLLHSGDPTPFVVCAPEQRRDGVRSFGETTALAGSLGMLRAADIAPLLHGLARRPFFIGHRPGSVHSASLPVTPQFMPIPAQKNHPPTLMESPR
jgi:2,3-bisphosphoglycerate-independent phosphoglycerate mutase